MKTKNISDSLQNTLMISTLILLPISAQAVEFSISGQVNRLLMDVDNGEEHGIVHADNSVSGSRWRVKGEGAIDGGMSAGLLYETQLQSNPSNKIAADTIDSDGVGGNVGDGDYFSTRQSNVWVRGDFGKITIGQGSGAADGSAEVDVSGTTVIQYSGSGPDLLGSMEYGDSGFTVGDVSSNFDGLGRNDNLRYDAAVDQLTIAASIGNGDKYEASLGYALDGVKIMLGFWDEKNSGNGVSGSALSFSLGASSGFNFTGAYGTNDSDGDPDNTYVKLGYKQSGNAYAIDWSETSDLGPGNASSYSVAWAGTVMRGIEMYMMYRVESLDNVSGADDIEALAGGARIKF